MTREDSVRDEMHVRKRSGSPGLCFFAVHYTLPFPAVKNCGGLQRTWVLAKNQTLVLGLAVNLRLL